LGGFAIAAFSLALTLVDGCGRSDQPSRLDAAPPPVNQGAASPDIASRIETAAVQYNSPRQGLVLSGKIAYGEDRYSRISSPLQGRVVEVRAHLGERVKMGDILLIVDSPDIAQAYSEYVKEDSDLR
jgi:cobalt-zinc-cadmium efflux system membrane fusion protein